MISDIFIISGTPGAGKSSIAQGVLQRYEFGFHIPIDDLREWVVSGIAHPLPTWTDETTRQFDLGYKATAQLASIYADAGFAVAIDQVIYPADVEKYFVPQLRTHRIFKICLQPDVNIALARNATRKNKDYNTAFLNDPIPKIHRSLGDAIKGHKDWIVIDSSNMTPEETIVEIFRQAHHAPE